MSHVSRRVFLRWLAASLGTAAGGELLSACGGTPTSDRPVAAPTKFAAPTKIAAPTALAQPVATLVPSDTRVSPTATAATAGAPDLVVTRGGEPQTLVQQALKALGGIERFVKPGNDVIVKPNICVAYHSYEYAATTNPWVVAELVTLCLGAGASRVRVLDYPFGGTPDQAYVRSGIKEQVEAAGGSMETLSFVKFVKTALPNAVDLHECEIYDDILKADVMINVPIAKHHSLARLTLGMKNLMGVISQREMMHANLGQRLADLAGRVRPALTVVDAVRILMNNGPTGGNLDDVKKLDTVIASADIVAADSYAATLFDVKPDDLAYIRAGVASGLGRSDLSNMKIEEIRVGG